MYRRLWFSEPQQLISRVGFCLRAFYGRLFSLTTFQEATLRNLDHGHRFFSAFILFFLSLCFFYLYFPLIYFTDFNGKRQLQLLIILSSHLLLFLPVIRYTLVHLIKNLDRDIQLCFTAFFVSGAIAASMAQFSLYAWLDFFQVASLCSVVFVLMAVFSVFPLCKKVLSRAVFLGFSILLLEIAIKSIVGLSLDGVLILKFILPDVGNVRFLNQVQVQLFFVLSFLSLSIIRSYRKYIFILSVVNVLLLLVTGARGALLALLATFLITSLFSNDELKKLTINTLKVFGLAISLYLFYVIYEAYYFINNLGTGSLTYLTRVGSAGRLSMWHEVLQVSVINPLGIGPYHYAVINTVNDVSHPHNSLLRFVLEWGWFAGAAVVVLGVKLGIHLVQVFRNELSLFRLSLACSLLAAGSYSLLGGLLIMPVSQLTCVLILALFFNVKNNSPLIESVDVSKYYYSESCKLSPFMTSVCCGVFIGYVFLSYESYSRYLSVSPLKALATGAVSTQTIFPVKSAMTKSISSGPRMWIHGGVVDLSNESKGLNFFSE